MTAIALRLGASKVVGGAKAAGVCGYIGLVLCKNVYTSEK